MSEFLSLLDLYYQTMWHSSGVPEDPKNDTLMAMHSAQALYSAVKGLMQAIRTEDQEMQKNVTHQIK